MSYRGKRSYNGRGVRRSGDGAIAQTMERVFLFPALLVYLELVMHIYTKTSLGYAPVYILFALAGGLICSALAMPFRRRANQLTA